MGSEQKQEQERMEFGVLVALGIALGSGVGAALGNVGMGSAFGLLVATVVNPYYERKEGKAGAGGSLALGLAALFMIVLLLLHF